MVFDVTDERIVAGAELRRMIDKRAVEEVLVMYCRLLDDRQFAALLELFTDDAQVHFWGRELHGKAALAAAYGDGAESTGRPTSAHVLSNVVIDIDGDRARATSDFTVISRAADGTYGVLVCGRFVDELLRSSDDSWRIRSRQSQALARG